MVKSKAAENLLFALDIGTRKVMGLVARQVGAVLEILAAELREHPVRPMLDGQVHDIEAVAEVVREVREALEEKVGVPLREVAVAAAGRSLLTRSGRAERPIDSLEEISPADVRALELEAVQAAERSLAEERAAGPGGEQFHCLGYSVLRYCLDGVPLSSLSGHRGRVMSAEVLATFLPGLVVDSLHTVVRRAGLTVRSMTLEPIAASNVVVPPALRNLNLALVDIGAGTSDIAITQGGAVVAYGMIPLAGDEITERLCHRYLLDFATAERVKRQLAAGASVEFEDVLGHRHTLAAEEILREAAEAVEEVARAIAEAIRQLNGRPPGAVVCVGGGSQMPLLAPRLAEFLGLPPERVVARGREAVLIPLRGQIEGLQGPEVVTPIGIAYSATNPQALAFKFAEVRVNGRRIRLFNLVAPRVADALLAAQIDLKRLRPRIGLSLTLRLNGAFTVIPGTPGRPGRILRNGVEVGLEDPLEDGDELTVEMAMDGVDALATVADLVPQWRGFTVQVEGKEVHLRPEVSVNGEPANGSTPIPDGAEVEVIFRRQVQDALAAAGEAARAKPFMCQVNGELRAFSPPARWFVNGRPAELTEQLQPGDVLLREETSSWPRVRDVLTEEERAQVSGGGVVEVTVNGEKVSLPGRGAEIWVNGRPASLEEVLPPQAQVEIRPGQERAVYFAEIFNYIPFELERKGGRLVMKLNGKAAEYTSPLRSGDDIEIFWE